MTRRKKVLLVVAGVAMLSAVSWCTISGMWYRAKIREEITFLEVEGGSTDIRDLAHRLCPGEPNAAPLVAEAAKVSVDGQTALTSVVAADESTSESYHAALELYVAFLRWHMGRVFADTGARSAKTPKEWNDEWVPYLEAIAEANSETLSLAKEASEIGQAVFEHDWDAGPDMQTPHVYLLGALVQLLIVEADLASKKGDMEAAFDSVYASIRLPSLLDGEPLVISKIAAVYRDFYSMPSIQVLLEAGYDDREGLGKLIAHLKERNDREEMAHALLGETASRIDLFDRVKSDPLLKERLFGGRPPKNHPIEQKFRNVGSLLYWNSTADEYNYLKAMREVRRQARLPWYEATHAPATPANRTPSEQRSYILTDMFLEQCEGLNLLLTRSEARARLAVTILALRLYDIDHGEFPDTLDALVGKYLDEVPLDPFDGKPLRYVKKDGAAVVYSVGDDATDNGGVWKGWGVLGGDIPWVLKRLETETETTE